MMMQRTDIPEGWKLLYRNPLTNVDDIRDFIMEGDGAASFPMGRMRLESRRDPGEGQQANFVLWCPEQFGADVALSWRFRPLREPGLAIMFFGARGAGGLDLFDPALPVRTGPYEQYHHGEMDAYHLSYFRRRWPEERQFHTCNLRKSFGFHLVAQGADPIPDVSDVTDCYELLLVRRGASITFSANGLPLLAWEDDGTLGGPALGGGRIGFRQMAPLIAEYSSLEVYGP
ncbi:uncharacterized protein DUF1961 [Paenibacillus cellulosilyticus]|uniref:Uncharacterized protein DUF1961 n=2 Tax=Paenibacillus cellulosilyticus TaxID=375489 RepID=A0A2V2YGR4_9BACL|nr:DUF1961 family protein [Paenibacillus cellulosilyticus]PWV90548.1 uncharacterized protein DUF1961 [Paenibacillus cellulosilyticus]